MSIVIVHGKQASGKTRRSQELMQHYGCKRIIDDWNGKDALQDRDLAITSECPPFKIAGARIVDFVNAKASLFGRKEK
jgi:hypothetical protein